MSGVLIKVEQAGLIESIRRILDEPEFPDAVKDFYGSKGLPTGQGFRYSGVVLSGCVSGQRASGSGARS